MAPEIPDDSYLYRRVPIALYCTPDRVVSTAAFALATHRNEEALSVDWADLCSPEETRVRDRRNPKCFAVVKIKVRCVRNVVSAQPRLTVQHNPLLNDADLEDNPAHALIWGDNGIGVRRELRDACTDALGLECPDPPWKRKTTQT